MVATKRPCAACVPCVAAIVILGGCANRRDIEPRPGAVQGLTPAEADARAAAVRRDPTAYLRGVAEKCRTLNQYTLKFVRYERVGVFQQLRAPEHIFCWFRRQPFSVRMKWLDEDSGYAECVYVTGQADNQVRFVTRRWRPLLAPPPNVNRVSLQAPVAWGASQQPLTDFGLERLMERTLDSYQRASDKVVISYQGLLGLPENGQTVHHIHLEYPESQHRVPIQELYIDVATDLPAGTVRKRLGGQIEAAYYYLDVKPLAKLVDADFLLPAERGATTTRPAKPATKRSQ